MSLTILTSSERYSDLPRLLEDSSGVVWVDMTGPSDADVQAMADVFQFHPLAIEDTRNFRQRPKVEEYAEYLFVILNPVARGQPGAVFRELDVFIGRNYVVTVHPDTEPVLEEVRQRIENTGPTLTINASYLLYVIMDVVVDGYFPVLDEFEEEIDKLGDTILTAPRQEHLNRLFDLKESLIDMWRAVWPQREILNYLAHHNLPYFDPEAIDHYLRDVSDHLMWVADMVTTFRDTLTGVMDLYMSAVSNRLNQVVNRLTVFTVIIGLLTVISGFYGMNFQHNWPPFSSAAGVPFALGLMTFVTTGLLVIFRRLGWY